ncbi:MAG: aminodeoxychorismate/anthranilate synthase component II [Actinobacteria bacterium]|nr:aminodeoxychorismate/anthranilate synthase component II [Actinomycetota bacterium]
MHLIIDNYDSFVHTLASYIIELGAPVEVVRNDEIDTERVSAMLFDGSLEGIIISPGPKSPDESGNCKQVVKSALGLVPILGVCLGHQILASAFGANVVRGTRPMHGKVTQVRTNGTGLFEGIPQSFNVTRYHSLVVDECSLPSSLRVDARADDGAVMAISHRRFPAFGVQFHPEAVLTDYGHEVLTNFIDICTAYKRSNQTPHLEVAANAPFYMGVQPQDVR